MSSFGRAGRTTNVFSGLTKRQCYTCRVSEGTSKTDGAGAQCGPATKENPDQMPLTKEQTGSVIERAATKEGDTGSPEVQVSLLTERINQLVEHVKVHKKDHS